MSNQGLLLILVLAGIVLYLVYDTYYVGNLVWVHSKKDKREYRVQDLPDKEAAADLLAEIRQRLLTLQGHLRKMFADDERTLRFEKNFRGDSMSEGPDKGKLTSYSVNKGEKIVFCLRSKDETKKLVDENTIMFVALHEVAHIVTLSTGHTEEFWDNFRWLLEEAIQIGIYKEVDYKKKPVPYCGIQITDSPLDH